MPGPSLNRVRAAPFRANRHYFHRPTRVGAWKVRLAVLALLAAAGWVAAAMIGRETPYAVCTHGELARAHAPWADKCDACHVPHGSESGAGGGLFDARDRWRSFRCETCHPGPAGDLKNYAPHYDRAAKPHLADDATARDCSSCHHDHQGARFALARVADSDCTRCHKDLSPLHGSSPAITAFHKDHPEFRAVDKPPARGLKFNHALHLATGLTEKPNLDNPNATWKLGDVPEAYRRQYSPFAGGGGLAAALRLDCTACHELAADGPAPSGLPSAMAPARTDGAYYLPVVFEKHCQGCHSLTLTDLQSANGVSTTGPEPLTVPHRRQPAELDAFLRAEFTRRIDRQKSVLLQVPVPPSDRLDPPRVAVPSNLGKEVDDLMGKAGQLLYGGKEPGEKEPRPRLEDGHGCLKCHYPDRPGAGPDWRIQPTGTPAVWLPAGRFSHAAHRMTDCAVCHNNWDQGPVHRRGDKEWSEEPVNLKGGVRTCQQCHAPSLAAAGSGRPGARHGCVDCHTYHAGSHPLQGRGSPLRDPPPGHRLSLDSFLRGTRHP